MTVIELGSFSQGIRDDFVSDLESVQNGRLWIHKQRVKGLRFGLVFGGMASNLAMAELIFEIAQLIQGALSTALLFG